MGAVRHTRAQVRMKRLAFIVSDDIRTEVGGKLSIMGAYIDQIVLPSDPRAPFAIPLAMYVLVQLEDDDAVPEHFRVLVLKGD